MVNRFKRKWEDTMNEIIYMWLKVFKNGPRKIYGRQSLKNLKRYDFEFSKSCLPHFLLGPFLNTLSLIKR